MGYRYKNTVNPIVNDIGIPGTQGSVFGGVPGVFGVTQGVIYPMNVDDSGNVFVHPGEVRVATSDGGTVSTQTLWYQRGKPSDYRGSSGG